jgi:hypothetical protein
LGFGKEKTFDGNVTERMLRFSTGKEEKLRTAKIAKGSRRTQRKNLESKACTTKDTKVHEGTLRSGS